MGDDIASKTISIQDVDLNSGFEVPSEYIDSGILQIVANKLVPGQNANKRLKRTKYGFETEAEIKERQIKRRLWNELNRNKTNLLPDFEDFRHMSFKEIDYRFDPTARNLEAFRNHVTSEEFENEKKYDRVRRRWVKYARKNGTWWYDQALKEVEDAKKRSYVPYDDNFTALYMKAFGNHDPRTYERRSLKEEEYYYGTNKPKINLTKKEERKKRRASAKAAKKSFKLARKASKIANKHSFWGWIRNEISKKHDDYRAEKIRNKAYRDAEKHYKKK